MNARLKRPRPSIETRYGSGFAPAQQAGWVVLAALFSLLSLVHAEPLTAEKVNGLRAQIRSHFFIPVALPPVEATTHRRFMPATGVAAEAVTYGTQHGLRVPAILYRPDPMPPGGRLPAFVVVNGHGGDKYAWYSYFTGVAFARAGMVVLTYDQAGEGERNGSRKSGTREHDRLQGGEAIARRLAGLMMTDVMQAVSYLVSLPEVDSRRIGAGGYSLGSFVLALAGAVEPRLRACVLVGGGNLDGPGGYWDSSKPMCQALPYRSLNILGDRPAVIYALHAARGPTLVWNGRADTVVGMEKTQEPFFNDLKERAVAMRGTTNDAFEFGFTDGASHRPYWLTRPVVLWLEQQLDFPRWSSADIRTLPETHVSAWSRRTGVSIDRVYASEEREGGTRAVGDHVPGFERESLSVFSPAAWEANKAQLLFEEWTAASMGSAER